jgi:hypothetical protein
MIVLLFKVNLFHLCSMKHLHGFVLLISLCFSSLAQENHFLTPENKAYIYHTVRKSPILESNIGRYIVLSGKPITLPNGEINYDSTEQVIINDPSLLKIYASEIQKAPKGILAELSNKVALWELNKLLSAQRSNDLGKLALEESYEKFESILRERLPEQAFRNRNNVIEVHPRVLKINNPTLTFNDKVAMLDGFANWSNQEKVEVIKAYNYAINQWVKERSFALFQQLGGEAEEFSNVLTAAGDGSNTSGMFQEREKDERGRWNKGLPKAVGLFPYEPYIGVKPCDKKKREDVIPRGETIHSFQTAGNGRETNIHFDVWGYNSDKQTTVVIEKGGKYYPLFGSSETRFLSPDSSFGEGLTYYTLIKRVQQDIVALESKVTGKKGYDYWINYNEERKDDKLLEIDKTEEELNKIRYGNITTNQKYVTDSNRKKRKKRQEKVVLYYSQLEAIKKKIRELEEDKEKVLDKKRQLEKKLQVMYNLIGKTWVSFNESEGLYVYEDSTTFDILTQEFVFPATEEQEVFDIKLLAIPLSHTSQQYDEVMLHMNIVDAVPFYTAQVQLELDDVFDSDQVKLETDLFSAKDSLGILEFFEALQDKKKEFKVIARGNGIGTIAHGLIKKKKHPETLDQYPGDTPESRAMAREDSLFKSLRKTNVLIFVDRTVTLEINSFTDPVKSNFSIPSSKIRDAMKKIDLSQNEVLSAYRTFSTLQKLRLELNLLAGEYLERPKAKDVIDRLNKLISKSRVTVGKTSFEYDDFLED